MLDVLEAHAAALMGADDRGDLAERIALLMDVLMVKRKGLLQMVTPIRDVRGATRVRAIFDRVARIDRLLALLAACYEEEAGAPWEAMEGVKVSADLRSP